MGEPFARRVFTLADQRRFAALSGDTNPVHLDPAYARRTLFGGAIVHGMHTLSWLLDAWLGAGGDVTGPVTAEFIGPVYLDEPVEVRSDGEGERLRLRVVAAGVPVLTVRFDRQPTVPAAADRTVPVADAAAVAVAFPHLARRFGAPAVAQVLAVSRVVGMDDPGANSILSAVSLRFEPAGDPLALHWTRVRHDPRYAVVDLGFAGGLVCGAVRALERPAPVAQPGYAALQAMVQPDEFAGARPLIVGGSRGLGEVAAKLLAAGGAEVWLTYRNGVAEAERVAAEIEAGGGCCSIVPCDVTGPPPLELVALMPDEIHYFATPPIFARRTADQAARFHAVYVDGLVRLVRAIARPNVRFVVFNPSSEAVEKPVRGMEDYAAAKAASEQALLDLAAGNPNLRALNARLPRVATDQTATIVPVAADAAADVLLPLLRRVAAARRTL